MTYAKMDIKYRKLMFGPGESGHEGGRHAGGGEEGGGGKAEVVLQRSSIKQRF